MDTTEEAAVKILQTLIKIAVPSLITCSVTGLDLFICSALKLNVISQTLS